MVQAIEDVELGDDEAIEAIDGSRVTQQWHVKPTAAARTPCDGAKFLAGLADELAALAEIIGEGPGQIDLRTTLVIVNTEFGRTPHRQEQAGQTGTNHWPWGYITMFIGGPVQGRSCYGRIGYDPGGAEDGYAVDYVTPAENRMMAMQAMGIYPFSSQSFAVGDVRGGVVDEEAAAQRIHETYLGAS